MNSKSKFAITLASLSFIFVGGILSIFTAYIMRGSVDNFKYKTQIMSKFVKHNKKKLMQIKSPSSKKMTN